MRYSADSAQRIAEHSPDLANLIEMAYEAGTHPHPEIQQQGRNAAIRLLSGFEPGGGYVVDELSALTIVERNELAQILAINDADESRISMITGIHY